MLFQNDHGGSAWVLNRKFATYQKMTVVCNTGPDGEESTFRYTQLGMTSSSLLKAEFFFFSIFINIRF